MIWNCSECGPLKPIQVTCEEKCGACQEPITYRSEPIVLDELSEHREAREKAKRLNEFNERIAKG